LGAKEMTMGRPARIAALFGTVFVLFSDAPALARPAACPAGRFMLSHTALIAGAGAPANDLVEIAGSQVSIGSGCAAAHVTLKAKKKFTLVSGHWRKCTGLKGPAMLKAKIAAPACDTLSGKFITPKSKPKRKTFTAKRVPIFSSPSTLAVGPEGGTFTNPNDGTSVTVPPGAYAPGQMAHVGVVAVGKADVFSLEQAVGLVPPAGFQLLEALQVIIPPSDPNPRLALMASMPDDNMPHPGLLIHTLIEPTSVSGEVDPRAANLVFDGEVTQADGRFSMQISPQNIAGSPGRGCVVNIPPTVPTCFVDGVVRDSNGSPVANAIVTVSNLSLVARTNAAGFYRGVVHAGAFTATATASIGSGTSASFNCDPLTMPRIPGVDVTISVATNPSVPVVTITDPATDVTVNQTSFNVTGTVSSSSITQVTIVTQTGDFADGLTQTAMVSGGTFSTTVVLSAGRENTVIVTATEGGLTGSAKRVITVTGSAGEDLRFTLTWDTLGDLDLYVRTPGPNGVADTVDGHTIYYANTSADGGTHDVDNTVGFGPENTVFPLGAAAPGTYAFAVEYYAGSATPTATVSVFVQGRLVGTFSQVLSVSDSNTGLNGLTLASPSAVFDIGTVTFPSGALGPPVPQTTFLGGSN
jgi:uncharacterized protein YfaP (DUF2135 family)